uniref:Uncharacterized protein n=1 Tax=viral metagenome TaxID=1070528 RepID=A0A6C0IJ80_9ZZZZ
MIKKILEAIHTTNGQYIISFILGMGMASLFRKICKDRNCLVFKAPDFDEVTKNVYTYDNKCYSFKKEAVECGHVEREISI